MDLDLFSEAVDEAGELLDLIPEFRKLAEIVEAVGVEAGQEAVSTIAFALALGSILGRDHELLANHIKQQSPERN